MRLVSFLILLVGFAQSSYSQVEFSASAPNVVEVGERFRLTYTINSEGSNFQAPTLGDFQILSGPNPSTSSSISIVNGQMQQSYNMSYTYVLQANKTGKFSIQPASIKANNQTYKSNSLQIEVVAGSNNNKNNNNNQQNSQQNNQQTNQSNESVSKDDLYIKINFNKSNPYVGEPIVATFKFYSKVSIYNISDATMPKYSGFYSKDLNPNQQIQTKTENINGQKYITGEIQRVLLIPQKAGEITIDPASIEFVLIKQVRPTHFFDDGRRQYQATVKSDPVKLKVKALPENKPEGFYGAVGNYNFTVTANKNTAKTNEAITVVTTISGLGNLELIDEPKLQFPPDFEIYDPKITPNMDFTSSGIKGSKTYEYLIIPRHEGTFSIPESSFSFFDPNTGKFKTLRAPKIDFTIQKGEGEEQVNIVQGYAKEDIQYLGKDISFIKTGDLNLEIPYFIIATPKYFALIGIPFLLLLTLIILRFKKIKENSNVAKFKNKKANKISQKRLKIAKKFLNEGKDSEYYEELMKAIWGYLSDKLTIPLAELTKDKVVEKLTTSGISEESTKELIDILNNCEFARYAPTSEEKLKEQLFNKAKEIITLLENKLK